MIMVSKKTNKLRGSKSHGYGSKKKHRGKGSRGGKGQGGSSKHNRSQIYSTDKTYFGKKGFTSLKKRNSVINLFELNKFDKEVNLTKLGYDKLLSNGELKKVLKITISIASKKAKEKVEQAGGQIISE
tara:strand:- start:92 stop:475 length:384 start_codon:yes stop_codon:yes gene_type:complete